jgi:acetyl-CoA acetyltransferase
VGTEDGPGADSLRTRHHGSLTDPFHDILMGVTAENLAQRKGISRSD